MNFVHLTSWNTMNQTGPCVVNLDNVTHMMPITRNWVSYDPIPEGGLKPDQTRNHEKGTRIVTCISFAAGLHEESDSIYVTETIDEILGE